VFLAVFLPDTDEIPEHADTKEVDEFWKVIRRIYSIKGSGE